jgi:hypothetical protein
MAIGRAPQKVHTQSSRAFPAGNGEGMNWISKGIVAGWDSEKQEKERRKRENLGSGVLAITVKQCHQSVEIASYYLICININTMHQVVNVASNLILMQHESMRTTITLDDDVHEFATYYANSKGITLSAAMNELIRKAEATPIPKPEPLIVFSPEGFPMFPPAEGVVTSEMVKKLEQEEYDPKNYR